MKNPRKNDSLPKREIKSIEGRLSYLEWWIDLIAQKFNLYDQPSSYKKVGEKK